MYKIYDLYNKLYPIKSTENNKSEIHESKLSFSNLNVNDDWLELFKLFNRLMSQNKNQGSLTKLRANLIIKAKLEDDTLKWDEIEKNIIFMPYLLREIFNTLDSDKLINNLIDFIVDDNNIKKIIENIKSYYNQKKRYIRIHRTLLYAFELL